MVKILFGTLSAEAFASVFLYGGEWSMWDADCHDQFANWSGNDTVNKRCGVRADVGSELSAAGGRSSEVSEWPRSKFPASAVRQHRNFGHRNRIIGPYGGYKECNGRATARVAPTKGLQEVR